MPTVVLVHDAFAGPDSWAPVMAQLSAADVAVLAPAIPLAGLASDVPHLSAIVRDIGGPVVLVGHGYGGAVVTEAAAGADNVTALGFVAGLGLDAGESWRDIAARFPAVPHERPVPPAVFTSAVQRPGWRHLPCWYAIAAADRVVHPVAQRFMAMRMAAVETELDASHAVLVSQPAAVARMITDALR